MERYYKTVLQTKAGIVAVVSDGDCILEAGFDGNNEGTKESCPLNDHAIEQLKEYFEGKRKAFDLPLKPQGTDFQKKVWECLLMIPYGETRTYKQIAIMAGNEKACRAVGMANHNNPLGIIIPCHRVIGADGKLTGYAGGLDKKEILLELEKQYKD